MFWQRNGSGQRIAAYGASSGAVAREDFGSLGAKVERSIITKFPVIVEPRFGKAELRDRILEIERICSPRL